MNGFRTYLVAALIALVTALVPALTGLDWVAVLRGVGVPEVWAVPVAGLIVSGLMAVMRSVTTTPPGNISGLPDAGKTGLFVGLIGAKIAALIVAGSLLTGCAGISTVARGVASSDAVLARLSQNSLPLACQTVEVASGYFDALKPRISAANVKRGEIAIMAARDICASPPRSTLDAIMTLSGEWSKIQAATKAR